MKEIFNSTLLFFIGAAIVLCVISTDVVFAEGKASSFTWTNTELGENIEPDFNESSKESSDSIRTCSTYYTSISALGKEVRAGMVDRKQTIIVKYKVSSSELSSNNWLSTLSKKIVNNAFAHTGVPEEGDSLKFCVKGYKSKASYFSSSGYSYITITFTFSYFTSSSQETKLDNKVDKLDLKGSSDYQTVKNIYNYICDNVKYSNSNGTLKYTAYNAAVNKSAVCQGYAVLFYRLALENGINTRVIAGKGKDDSHVWNIVKLGSKYYCLDSTWDAGESKYKYFLKGYNDFSNHTCNSEYSTKSFKSKYPISATNFKCTSHKWKSSYTIDKKPTYAAAGSKSIHCSVCGCKKSSSITTIPKLVCKIKGPANAKTNLTSYYGNLAGYDDLKITWDKRSAANGYRIKYRKVNTDKWYTKHTTNGYVYLKDLSDGYRYEIKITPYVVEKGIKYYSINSTTMKSVYTLKKTNIITKETNTDMDLSLTWKGIEGETGYQIYISAAKDGTYSKVATVNITDQVNTSVNISAEAGVTYWYKIRAYKSIGNGKCVYGPWSDKISYTI